MPAYVIANVTIQDPERFAQYQRGVPATIESHGGRYLIRGGAFEVAEGDWHPGRVVVLEFPTMEQARAWYHCAEYEELKRLRLESAHTDVVFVEGVPPVKA